MSTSTFLQCFRIQLRVFYMKILCRCTIALFFWSFLTKYSSTQEGQCILIKVQRSIFCVFITSLSYFSISGTLILFAVHILCIVYWLASPLSAIFLILSQIISQSAPSNWVLYSSYQDLISKEILFSQFILLRIFINDIYLQVSSRTFLLPSNFSLSISILSSFFWKLSPTKNALFLFLEAKTHNFYIFSEKVL